MSERNEVRLEVECLEERIAPSMARGLLGYEGHPGHQGGHGGLGGPGNPSGSATPEVPAGSRPQPNP